MLGLKFKPLWGYSRLWYSTGWLHILGSARLQLVNSTICPIMNISGRGWVPWLAPSP